MFNLINRQQVTEPHHEPARAVKRLCLKGCGMTLLWLCADRRADSSQRTATTRNQTTEYCAGQMLGMMKSRQCPRPGVATSPQPSTLSPLPTPSSLTFATKAMHSLPSPQGNSSCKTSPTGGQVRGWVSVSQLGKPRFRKEVWPGSKVPTI